MYNKKYQFLFPLRRFLKLNKYSERELAQKARLSRTTFRSILVGKETLSISSLQTLIGALGFRLTILVTPASSDSAYSTVAVSMKVLKDGPNSWKTHYMDFVDEFRRTLDPQLILLPPVSELALPLRALLASMVVALCEEIGMNAPDWARKRFDLAKPWFVSEIENLKATAILESPMAFRRNNIFVQGNILERA